MPCPHCGIEAGFTGLYRGRATAEYQCRRCRKWCEWCWRGHGAFADADGSGRCPKCEAEKAARARGR